MAKRIYFESIKKWAKRAGISGMSLIGLMFMYLFAVGAISDVSYSGDMVCAGTESDPCYAYINFTAEEDIFIYPTGYDPWGRDTPFDFDPNIKSWRLERSWGKGWRNIPLDKSCTGTWCGLSNSQDERKFSIAFRDGKSYQVRIVAFKYSPLDSIKWGAFSGVDRIDPVWLPVEDLALKIMNVSEEWNSRKASGEEEGLIPWFSNKSAKKTELGWIVPNNDCNGWSDKYLKYANGTSILDNKGKVMRLKCESSKCSGQNCYHLSLTEAQAVNINEYVKLGENSFVYEYQNISLLNYNLDWAEINVTLYKNISNTWNNTINDLFIFYNNNTYKFGANDTVEEIGSLNRYKYKLESNTTLYKDGNIIYIKSSEITKIPMYQYYQTHKFDFGDICKRESENITADCIFTNYTVNNINYYEVTFTSDKNIDPSVSIGAADWITSSIFVNVTPETGDSIFTHLNLSNEEPYNSLISYWNFDGDEVDTEGTTAYDYSNFNLDGTMTQNSHVNTTGCIDGYEGCLHFDGVNDRVNYPGMGNKLNNKTMTALLWIYTKQANTGMMPLFRYLQFSIQIRGSGQDFTADVYNQVGRQIKFDLCAGTFDVDEWVHVGFTTNGTHIIGYKNGAVCGSSPFAGGMADVNNDIIMGTNLFNGGDMNGTIDEVMVFNATLTTQQINDIYNNASNRFLSTGKQDVIDQSFLNISSGNNRVNVSTTIKNPSNSKINLTVGYYDGSWSATAPQTIESVINSTFEISSTSTNLTLNYTFISGNSTVDFYSPIILGDIIINAYSGGAVEPLISITRIFPTGNVNVTQNEFFRVELEVECTQGACGTINVSLDPKRWFNG